MISRFGWWPSRPLVPVSLFFTRLQWNCAPRLTIQNTAPENCMSSPLFTASHKYAQLHDTSLEGLSLPWEGCQSSISAFRDITNRSYFLKSGGGKRNQSHLWQVGQVLDTLVRRHCFFIPNTGDHTVLSVASHHLCSNPNKSWGQTHICFQFTQVYNCTFCQKAVFKLLISWPAMKIKPRGICTSTWGIPSIPFSNYDCCVYCAHWALHNYYFFFFLSKEPFQHEEKDTHLQ